MQWLLSGLRFFLNILMPVSFRRPSLPDYRASMYLHQGWTNWEQPEGVVEDKPRATAGTVDETLEEPDKAPAEPAEKAETTTSWWITIATILRWVLHVLLIFLVLVGLWYLNWLLGLEKVLQSPWPFLHPFWLPILFLLAYALLWLGIWLWKLSAPDRLSWDYPDLTAAWEIAVQALERAGIDVKDTPVFLVLGQNEGSLEQLFGSAALRLRITAPRGKGIALRVYADEERILVTCPGASVLARQARFLMQQTQRLSAQRSAPAAENLLVKQAENVEALAKEKEGAAETTTSGTSPEMSQGTEENKTTEETNVDVKEEKDKETAEADLSAAEEDRIAELLAAGGGPQPATKSEASFLRNTAEMRLLTSRLHHLCRLIANDRKPFCSINGILLLLPFAAARDDTTASQTASACRHDLTVVHRVLQVECPVYALVCDMEKSDGFRELVQRLPSHQRTSRLGQPFPLYPDIGDEEAADMVESGVAWLSDALLPSLVYNLFRLEPPEDLRQPIPMPESLESNMELYRFLYEMRDCRQRLSRLLVRGLLLDVPGTFLFGGVYLAATGPRFTAFVSGVVDQMVGNQNYVSWTQETLQTERQYRRWSWVLFVLNLLLLAGIPVLVWFSWISLR